MCCQRIGESLDTLFVGLKAKVIAQNKDGPSLGNHPGHEEAGRLAGRIMVRPGIGYPVRRPQVGDHGHRWHTTAHVECDRFVDRGMLLRIDDNGVAICRPDLRGKDGRRLTAQHLTLDDDGAVNPLAQTREFAVHPIDQRQFRPSEQNLDTQQAMV